MDGGQSVGVCSNEDAKKKVFGRTVFCDNLSCLGKISSDKRGIVIL